MCVCANLAYVKWQMTNLSPALLAVNRALLTVGAGIRLYVCVFVCGGSLHVFACQFVCLLVCVRKCRVCVYACSSAIESWTLFVCVVSLKLNITTLASKKKWRKQKVNHRIEMKKKWKMRVGKWFMRVVVVPAAAAEAVFIIVATYGAGHLLCLYKHLQLLLLLLLIYLYRFFSASDSKLDLCYSCPSSPLPPSASAAHCATTTTARGGGRRRRTATTVWFVRQLSFSPTLSLFRSLRPPSLANIARMSTDVQQGRGIFIKLFYVLLCSLPFAVISFCLNNYDKLRFYGLSSEHAATQAEAEAERRTRRR